MEKNNELVLEPSTNTHKLVSKSKIKAKKLGDSTIKIETEGESLLLHGQHGTLATESNFLIKYNQQELNPVTQKMRNAFD